MYFVFETSDDAYAALPQFESEASAALRAQAERDRQSAVDSFERCDTDGFVSQWASGVMANQRDREAALADRGNLDVFPALLDEAGNIHARIYTFQSRFSYGNSHVFKVQRGDVVEWVNAFYAKDSTYLKKGLRKVWVMAPAKVMRDRFNRIPEQTGLGGCAGYNGEHARLDCDAAGL